MSQETESRELPQQDSQSQFSQSAWKQIWFEAVYLLVVSMLSLVWLAILWWAPNWVGLDVNSAASEEFQQFALAWLAGILGGAAFALKWLYHSVGVGPLRDGEPDGWTIDRRLWRIFVPILSGVMSAAFYAVLRSGLLNLEIKTTDANENAFAAGFGFIVGYFSDRAAVKLKDVAQALFGTSEHGSSR